ncbi:MAG: trypsin-like peptidase domain-containing protein [Armatimonadota bacterium]
MSNVRRTLAFLLFAVSMASFTVVAPAAVTADISALEAMQNGFRAVQSQVSPAVVSITSQMAANQPTDPFEFFFGGPRSTPRVQKATGSGVIIKPEGIVLTNSHVVANATKVQVQLAGSDKLLAAEVVQTDPRSDLAIVRITEKGTYPAAKLGDAGTVRVGDWSIAFGSPFRLPSTMTIGIISAVGRVLTNPTGDGVYRDLLQTDASINPGNSGGPLVNIRGEIVGINFMIYSPGEGGSVGIGFAIPINDYTRRVIDSLSAGQVFDRGRLGVYVKNLDDAMREAFGVADGGAFVDSVVPGQAGDKAGIKAEDVIVNFNGTQITNVDQFIGLVETTKPGTKVTITLVRNKKEMKVTATVGGSEQVGKNTLDERKVGAMFISVTPEIADRAGFDTKVGALITKVAQGSPADDAGLQPGDVILRVGAADDSSEIKTADDFWKQLSTAMGKSKKGVLLRIERNHKQMTITLPQIETTTK